MSAMRLSSLLSQLESDSEDEATGFEWGQSAPRFDGLNGQSASVDADDIVENTKGRAGNVTFASDNYDRDRHHLFSPMRNSPGQRYVKPSQHEAQHVDDAVNDAENDDDDDDDLFEKSTDVPHFVDRYSDDEIAEEDNGNGREGDVRGTVRVSFSTTKKGPSLNQSFSQSPGAMRQPSRFLRKNQGDSSEDDDEGMYGRFGLSEQGTQIGENSDVKFMNKLLMEAESQSEESMFRMAVKKHDYETGAMYGSEESKGKEGVNHRLRIHLSASSSLSSSAPRPLSPSKTGSSTHHADKNREIEARKAFNPAVFSPKNRAEIPLEAVQPFPAPALEHNNPESKALFLKRVRKAVVAAFEDIARERGVELTRNEYDDFLAALNLIPGDEEDRQGGVYQPENTQRYVLALRLAAHRAGSDGVFDFAADPTLDSENFALKAGQAVDIEGALAIVEVAHGLKALPEHLAVPENLSVIESMRTHMRGYSTESVDRRVIGAGAGAGGGGIGTANSPDAGNGVGGYPRHHPTYNTSVTAPGPGKIARRSLERWNNLLRTEQAKFDHHHTFKPTLYSVPTTNRVGQGEHFSWDGVAHHFPKANAKQDEEDGKESGGKGGATRRQKDKRTSEQRLIDEHCTFSPKFHTTEKAYDRMMLSVLRKAKKKGNGQMSAHINIRVGGMYTEEDGFVPGPPSSTNIPLFYFNNDHTPHWHDHTYHEYQYDPDVDADADVDVANADVSVVPFTPQVTGQTTPAGTGGSGVMSPQHTAYPTPATTITTGGTTGGAGGAGSADLGNVADPFMSNWPSPGAEGVGSPTPAPVPDPAITPGDSIPTAPPLPEYTWRGGLDVSVTKGSGGGEGGGAWAGRKKKEEEKDGDKKASGGGRPPAKSPMEAVMDEMRKRFKDGSGALNPVESAEKKASSVPGKLAGVGGAGGKKKKRKKKRRGAVDYGDVINELQKRLARLRGEQVSESEDDGDDESDDDEDAAADAAGGGQVSSLMKKPDAPAPPATALETKVGLGGVFAKAGDSGQGVEPPPLNTDPVACLPSSPSVIPSAPPLPASWPPFPDSTVITAPAHHTSTAAAAPQTALESSLAPATPAAAAGGGGHPSSPAPSSASAPAPALVAPSKPAGVLKKDLVLPEGYYQPSPAGTHKVIPHGILRVGLVTKRVIIDMKKEWREAELMARWASEDGAGVEVPASWWSGIDRLRRAREFREARKREKEKLDLRYHSDESEEEDYMYREVTRPQEFKLQTDKRAADKEKEKERVMRQRFGERDKRAYALNRQGFERGMDTHVMGTMRRGSMSFAVGLRDYGSPSQGKGDDNDDSHYPGTLPSSAGKTGTGSNNNPGDYGPPTLHSMLAFEKSKQSRKERELRYHYLETREAKKEEDRRRRLHAEAQATYPEKQIQHPHERMLLRYSGAYPGLVGDVVEAHRKYEDATETHLKDNQGFPRYWHGRRRGHQRGLR